MPRRKGAAVARRRPSRRPSRRRGEPRRPPAGRRRRQADSRRPVRRRRSRPATRRARPTEADGPTDDGEPEADGRGRRTSVDDGPDEIRDLALAAETSGRDEDGHEVTSPPSDADQDETNRIVTEAVEAGASPQEIVANEAGGGPNVPPAAPDGTVLGRRGRGTRFGHAPTMRPATGQPPAARPRRRTPTRPPESPRPARLGRRATPGGPANWPWHDRSAESTIPIGPARPADRPGAHPGGVAVVHACPRVGERTGSEEPGAARPDPGMGPRRQGQHLRRASTRRWSTGSRS